MLPNTTAPGVTRQIRIILTCFLAFLPVSACLPVQSNGESVPEVTPVVDTIQVETNTPFQPDPTPALPTSTPAPRLTVWLPDTLPSNLHNSLSFPPQVVTTGLEEEANFRFGPLENGDGAGVRVTSQWVYAVAVPFGTITDEISLAELRKAWGGDPTGPFAGAPILVDPSTMEAMASLFGLPAPGAVEIVPADELSDAAWSREKAWAILPFELLQPRWKVLKVDGQTPLSKKFDAETYPLTVLYGFSGDPDTLDYYFKLASQTTAEVPIPTTNRDPELLSEVVVTGVTAMVRATASRMRTQGNLYPARDIGPILMSADITHISNEVAFAEDCPSPDPNSASLKFCSNPSYIELLTSIGTDVVELSGNHVNDWGWENLAYSLEIYRDSGIAYYAGGADTADSRKPVLIEDHGNRIAFIGCNPAGPRNAWATDTQAGSANCEGDWLPGEVTRLREEGWLPIVTLQFAESYNPAPLYPQQDMFRSLAEAGAVVVSGSQAHLPQGFGFWGDALIHYGLGNLFFDQMYYDGLRPDLMGGTRWEFIDQHYFYENRYLGANILTAQLEDFAKPRLMTEEERTALLELMFEASDWNTELEENE